MNLFNLDIPTRAERCKADLPTLRIPGALKGISQGMADRALCRTSCCGLYVVRVDKRLVTGLGVADGRWQEHRDNSVMLSSGYTSNPGGTDDDFDGMGR